MDCADLTEEQNSAVAHFQEFTQMESMETAIQYLSAHEWNVERAINTALTSNFEPTTPISPSPPPSPPPTTTRTQTPMNTSIIARYMPNYALQLLRMPLSFLYTFYSKLQPFFPFRMLRVALTFFRSFFTIKSTSQRISIDPIREIDNYCVYFNEKFGFEHTAFYRGTLTQALQDAQREVRLLFVYLHDHNSQLCERFCREILCQDALRTIIGNHLLWSSRRDTQQGIEAANLLNINRYPCFCILAHHGSQQTVQFKLDCYTDCDECLAEILNGVQQADEALEHNRERRNQSQSRDRLLEEQNAAYLDSLHADQEKAEQRAKDELERNRIEQEEELERNRIEQEEQRKLQEFAEFRQRIKQTLPSEPLSTDDNTIQVSIRLPVDEPIRRRFRKVDSAKLLFEFAWSNSNVPDQFELLWGYPRKRYQYEQINDETIGELMNGNTETCYLEQIHDEK